MCGLTGFHAPTASDALHSTARHMADALTHRGPDDAGVWADEPCGLVLAHRRLSVLELSAAGHQPMLSSDQRYVIAFNGEIYNHLNLRGQLDAEGRAPPWRGHSDTETLLACASAWGVQKTLASATGMFAFALWDRQTRQLVLARDRLGEKPLYWGWQNDVLLFGSELKALRRHPAFQPTINRQALASFMRHGYISAPHSIYQDVHKLPPGHWLTLDLANPEQARAARSIPYWSVTETVASGLRHPLQGTPDEAVDALEQQLSLSVRSQMLSDVPLGAFLSGGIDSSVIVALMQSHSTRPVRTFTIGFDDPRYDEAPHAAAIARHLGTEHTAMVVRPGDALALIPSLPDIYDEPFADSSQIPTLLVSKLTRAHVTVALSGDGGDELFGGYNTFRFAPGLWRRIQSLPKPLRGLAASLLAGVPPARWDAVLNGLRRASAGRLAGGLNADKLHKLSTLLSSPDQRDFYRQLSSHWADPGMLVRDVPEASTPLSTPGALPGTDCFEHDMMAASAAMYMPDDILVKVDRAAMAHSLEVRVPMLDHRVVELAWRMPLSWKIRAGEGKWPLRQLLYRHVPQALMDRPKKGFSVPLAKWLRGPLREWAQALLDPARLAREGYLNAEPIQHAWRQHLAGHQDHSQRLWCVLSFQAWLQAQQA
ncbi:asparagine synthase (glutamine-hydrolyzing) [Pusillimonas sp. SM2304]|uniref:asparagine synthase (glutamine-hydrolyzing) n=1 Tax=Pusillimonas sp. SM2304 TaxID=3073241 RepID=UPI002875D493|nr:asparagine synthase (glutamine-hydrolyzing) [Pusillimonas sp. SM2304]MDS1140061.1 asparagine synthase (glutamine-hydrolyzing) [Pusillimonas sp. SM2304]